MLPGYNCGGCGNPGCSGMATKLVSGECKIEQCKPSKPAARAEIQKYLDEHKEAPADEPAE
jgi:electron transport complex protein RnfB